MFRKNPPFEIVEQVLRSLKFTDMTDKRWFTKEELPLDTLEDWVPLLEPFYLPCKASRYLDRNMTQARIITVLRHILKVHGAELKVQERMVSGRKTTLYQVFYDYLDPVVRFD